MIEFSHVICFLWQEGEDIDIGSLFLLNHVKFQSWNRFQMDVFTQGLIMYTFITSTNKMFQRSMLEQRLSILSFEQIVKEYRYLFQK